ncbi:sensor histidine kinase [uncultured Tissierella sp.]|uniref:sensor histidine kinase n=1 Tax=uncultured Tissierella sp. TaxID=448160 RepID=UPI0028059D86|nr:sensor histidine kinase [uncultured Tissierella sp.]MDU5081723.1 sensor histidine kinase [Bacillota bacterium]
MKNIYKYNNYLYRVLQTSIGLDIIYRCKDNITALLISFGLFLVIVINDHLRRKYFYRSVKKYYSSIFISMAISLMLALKISGYIEIYLYMILYELILYTEGKISRLFISLEIIFILTLILLSTISGEDIGSIEFWKENILDVIMVLMSLFFYSVSLFGYKVLRKEKREVERLNKELELSYNKLKEQSERIEELTIAKERNRVAGEIHDNLGHSLIALNMNLDVAEKIIEKDIIRAKELIDKSQILTKESMESLRKAVYALKDERNRTLLDSIEKIVDNIENAGEVSVILNIDEKVEELLPEYKDIIYTSIKEALTNSIKHGRADKINIDIKLDEDEVRVGISDNGLGCVNLIKGNGLMGIENKVKAFGGKIIYNREEKQGFNLGLIFKLNYIECTNEEGK